MRIQLKLATVLIFLFVFTFSTCGGDSGSTQSNPDNISGTNKEIIIKPMAVINKNLFAMANPGFEYSQLADCVIVRLNDDLLQGAVPAGIPQMFTLDKSRKTIFYSPDSQKINEYSIQSYTINPDALAVSKDGVIFVSDRGAKSIVKFTFNGLTLHYEKIIYSDVLAVDIAIDKNSNIYIADEKQNRILKIDDSGNAVNSFVNNGIDCNFIDSYKNIDGNNMSLNGLRSIFVDTSGCIYTICGYGRTLTVLQPNGLTQFVLYISPQMAVVDLAVTDKIIYMISNVSNTLLLINKESMDVLGKLEMPMHSYPWGKIENINKISVYTPSNLIVVLGKDGAEIFTEQY